MARNRKRAKERRQRRPAGAARPAPGVATANAPRTDEAPEPIEHATPDVELAEAQLAVGRPELPVEPGIEEEQLEDGYDEPEDELYFEDELEPPLDDEATPARGGELTPAPATAPEPSGRSAPRIVTFLQGSWRELQRVQWPDRRAVMQATGVVIGFVIVAGLYLGLADQVASKIVSLIIK